MGLLPDYANQAIAYDSTRSASPSVLAPLRRALAGAPGTRLADIGGGTGNYALALAAEGWAPVVIDRSLQMLAHASGKGLETTLADAGALPFEAECFDAAMLVSMLHHVDSPAEVLGEARRVLRAGGRLAAMLFTREDIADAWCLEYFPSARPWMLETHLPLRDTLAELRGAQHIPVVYEDLRDASLAALLGHPQLLLERGWRAQTSFFERLERDRPQELRVGLQRLAADVRSGRAPSRRGRASMIAWVKPDGRAGAGASAEPA
jgi:ubiquinone/menaquinone biosynthesis C-methylase UbiE